MYELTGESVLHAPRLTVLKRDRWTIFLDGESPNWVSVDEKGGWLLSRITESPRKFSWLMRQYAERFNVEGAKAWVHVSSFISEALRHKILSTSVITPTKYGGRSEHLELTQLRECWLQTNNSCNLTCAHCLVGSSPKGEQGLTTSKWRSLIDQAVGLGVDRIYITGGEPFVRQDMGELIRHVSETHKTELIVLTNATLFGTPRCSVLNGLNPDLVKFQVSIDGSTSKINDPIRGKGSFDATIKGLKELILRGFDVTITTVAACSNLDDLSNVTRLASENGVRAQHLMWIHRRGRIANEQNGWFPSNDKLIPAVRAVSEEAGRLGVVLDNAASFELRANAPSGIKFDLGNAGWQSLCVYADGEVYPSAAFANHAPLKCGNAADGRTLEDVWRKSPVLNNIRDASVVRKTQSSQDPLRYLTGGGDVEHSYFFSGRFLGDDPYYSLYHSMLLDAMDRLTGKKVNLTNKKSGYDVPLIYHAMGDGAVVCGTTEVGAEDMEVAFLHSNCVLSFDVEKPRKIVQEFYGEAAERPQAELCCPTKYDQKEVGHIPQDVLDRFYGCGSPVISAQPKEGEVYVDLGSGAGIDCFIAAKHVGKSGKVIGIDMTDEMLKVSQENKIKVAQSLGYGVVEFHKGYLEEIPVEDKSANVVTSNCVVNLSPDKPKVFSELWRILKDHGRAVIADIVSDREVPPQLKVNERLWGECIVGALTQDQFLAMLEQAGFYGLSVLKKSFWKEIEGFKFYSVTVRGFKFEKTAGCTYIWQMAIYKGPQKAVIDEEGHLFPRNVAVNICTDTASKLSNPPYAGSFTILEPTREERKIAADGCCSQDEDNLDKATCC